MLFAWLKQRRRRQLLATPFPDEWLTYLRNNVSLYAPLTEAEQAKLRDDLRVFVAERPWEGCGGLAVTDEMKVTIAAQACLLVLNLEHDDFGRVPHPRARDVSDDVPHVRVAHGDVIDEQRVCVAKLGVRREGVAGVKDERDVIACRQFVIRDVIRVLRTEMQVTEIALEGADATSRERGLGPAEVIGVGPRRVGTTDCVQSRDAGGQSQRRRDAERVVVPAAPGAHRQGVRDPGTLHLVT